MGYRSHVILAIKKDVLGKNLNKLGINYLSIKEEIDKILLCSSSYIVEKDWVLYEWINIKWYEKEYRGINWLVNLMKRIDQKEYCFLRIGEGYDDTEELGNDENSPFDIGFRKEAYWN